MTAEGRMLEAEAASSAPSLPLVSIVLRTKDRPMLLPRAVASIMAQRYPRWNLHVINDGGNAASVDRIIDDAGSDARITITHLGTTGGMEAASNIALAAAAGDYLAVHDDDDAWHPDFLTRTVDVLRTASNPNLVGVFANCEVVKERLRDDSVDELGREPWEFRPFCQFEELLESNLYPPICLLAKTDAVRRCGAFNAHLQVLGDWDFNIRLLAVGDIDCLDEVLAYYHWRVETDVETTYGNTIIQQKPLHDAVTALYRNGRIRAYLDSAASADGLLHALIPRLVRIEELLARQARQPVPDHVVRRIATEVWFEKQRWGLAWKVKERFRPLFAGRRRRQETSRAQEEPPIE